MAPGQMPGMGGKGGEKGGMRKSLPRMALHQFHHLFRFSLADRAEMSRVFLAAHMQFASRRCIFSYVTGVRWKRW
ncbi:hypothetical protein [Nitrosomonas sp. Nm33]|uniref:hypothetical protein n=1 Tax=Nitrosomonas sp. Nm33 TaxID=133724 RepID=UPI000B844F11|nr:hypothetical protein [Nitrosomonas sp. Nm33]